MNIRVHYPDSAEDMELLTERINEVHAKIIINYVSKLKCNSESKLELLERIKARCQ